MEVFRRIIAWTSCLGFLAVVGVGVYHFVRYRPRCTVDGWHWILHVSGDGRWLVTRKPSATNKESAVLEVWDTNTGRVEQSFATGVYIPKSPDARYFASVQKGGALQLIDWQSGESWSMAEAPTRDSKFTPCMFSPGGTWLCIRTADEPPHYSIVEPATRKVVRRLAEPFVGFSKDDRHVVCWTSDKNLRVLDMQTGEESGTLALEKGLQADSLHASIGQSSLVVGEYVNSMVLRVGVQNTTFRRFEVWDLNPIRRKWPTADLLANNPRECRRMTLANEGRFLATWIEEKRDIRLEVIDLEVGRICVKHSTHCEIARQLPGQSEPSIHGANAIFSPDDRFFLFYLNLEKTMMFDVASGELLWTKPIGFTKFIDENTVVWHDEKANRYEVLDARTGNTQRVLFSGLRAHPREPTITPSGRLLLASGTWQSDDRQSSWTKWLGKIWPKMIAATEAGVIVSETTTGRELLRLQLKQQVDQSFLSGDGSTLVTTFGDTRPRANPVDGGFQVWDVRSHRAWFWAVAWPLSLGVVLRLLRHWRLRRKAVI